MLPTWAGVSEPKGWSDIAMSPIGHLQYGWWFAHWGGFGRRERAVIALAGAGPDLDGLSLLAGGDTFHCYHHILFHNIGATLAVLVLAGVFFWRKPLVWLLVTFAFAMHVVEDYVTVGWDQPPWQPFSASVVNLSHHLPNWMVQGVFQVCAMVFILGMTVWIYLHHHRTPLEIISPAVDRILVNYAVLPWRNRCPVCGHRAHFRCDGCSRTFCSAHGSISGFLKVRCPECAAQP